MSRFHYSQDQDGNFLFKSYKDKKKPKKYSDPPRYPVIGEYEGMVKKEHSKMLQEIKKDLVSSFKKIL